MCFFLCFDVVLQRNTPTTRAAFAPPTPPPGSRLEGKFPRWYLTNGHCSCGFVDKGGAAVDPNVIPLLRALVSDAQVKRIELLFHWGDDPPAAPETKRLGIDDFVQKNQDRTLAANTRYRINDPSRWTR